MTLGSSERSGTGLALLTLAKARKSEWCLSLRSTQCDGHLPNRDFQPIAQYTTNAPPSDITHVCPNLLRRFLNLNSSYLRLGLIYPTSSSRCFLRARTHTLDYPA